MSTTNVEEFASNCTVACSNTGAIGDYYTLAKATDFLFQCMHRSNFADNPCNRGLYLDDGSCDCSNTGAIGEHCSEGETHTKYSMEWSRKIRISDVILLYN